MNNQSLKQIQKNNINYQTLVSKIKEMYFSKSKELNKKGTQYKIFKNKLNFYFRELIYYLVKVLMSKRLSKKGKQT